jgi:anaerobic selenocysteine-containing dehydrogenase
MDPNMAEGGMKVVKSVCDRCHGTCGVLAYVKEGRVVKVEGIPHEARGGKGGGQVGAHFLG